MLDGAMAHGSAWSSLVQTCHYETGEPYYDLILHEDANMQLECGPE